MDSDNLIGAGNQQERPCTAEWIAGFTDGEGCFSISIVRNAGCRLGWQVQHEFAITQSESSIEALQLVREHFGCGRIIVQDRRDIRHGRLARFSVKAREDLMRVILPFFGAHPLVTAKQRDLELFSEAMELIVAGEHLEVNGLREIARLTERMNRKQPSRYLESSEAIRRPSRSASR